MTAAMPADTGRPLRIYASTETHTWLQKAADQNFYSDDALIAAGGDPDGVERLRAR